MGLAHRPLDEVCGVNILAPAQGRAFTEKPAASQSMPPEFTAPPPVRLAPRRLSASRGRRMATSFLAAVVWDQQVSLALRVEPTRRGSMGGIAKAATLAQTVRQAYMVNHLPTM